MRPTGPVRDIIETFFGNLGAVIKSIPTCPVSTGTAGQQGDTEKKSLIRNQWGALGVQIKLQKPLA